MAVVEIILRTIDQSRGSTGKLTGELTKLAAQYLSIGAVATTAAKAVKFSIDQAAEAEKVNAQLATVLQSTGGAAGMSADELDKMATSLSRVSMVDDETIKRTEALMLTFTKIGREVFPEAIQATLDMSAALGQDLQSSTIQLGKALNDPIKGITALSRVGVSFTEEQKNMIKTLVESGDTLSAQKIILRELSTEFGGQALAASKTYTGQTAQLKNEVGNLGEAIGNELLPEVTQLTSDTKELTIWIQDNFSWIKKWVGIIGSAFMPVETLVDGLLDWRRESRGLTSDTDGATESTIKFGAAGEDMADTLGRLTLETEGQEEALKRLTEANQGMLDLIGNMQSAEDSYHENAKKLNDERIKIEGEKAAAIAAGWWEGSEKIKEYDAALLENTAQVQTNEAEFKRANLEIISGLVERKLMQDGVLDDAEFEWLLKKRQEWGLYSSDVVAKARAAWKEADRISASVANIPSNKTITIVTNHIDTYGQSYAIGGGGAGSTRGRASGGDMFAGTPYRVGERGPEVVVPGQNSTVVPNDKIGGEKIDYKAIGREMERAYMRAMQKAGG